MTDTAGPAGGVIGAKGNAGRPATERAWIVRDGARLAGAQAAEAVALAALAPWLLARLGPVEFGAWVAVTGAAALAGLADAGVASAPGRVVARAVAYGRRSRVRELVTTAALAELAQAAALLTVGWIAAPAAADLLVGAREEEAAVWALRLGLAAVLALRLATVFDGTLVGLRRVGTVAGIRLARTLLYVGLAVPAATVGLEAVLAAQLVAQVAALIAAALAARAAFGERLLVRAAASRDALSELLRYGVPRRIATAGAVLAQRAGPVGAALVAGSIAAAEAGLAFLVCGGLAMLVAQAATPLTASLADRDRARLAARHRRALVAAALAAAAAFGALAAAAPGVVRALAGDELGGATEAIRWLAPGFALLAVANVASIGGQASGHPELEGRAAALGAPLVAALAGAGAVVAGASGAAAGTTLALAAWSALYLSSLGRAGLETPAAALWPLLAGAAVATAVAAAGGAAFDVTSLGRGEALAVAAAQAAVVVALVVGARVPLSPRSTTPR